MKALKGFAIILTQCPVSISILKVTAKSCFNLNSYSFRIILCSLFFFSFPICTKITPTTNLGFLECSQSPTYSTHHTKWRDWKPGGALLFCRLAATITSKLRSKSKYLLRTLETTQNATQAFEEENSWNEWLNIVKKWQFLWELSQIKKNLCLEQAKDSHLLWCQKIVENKRSIEYESETRTEEKWITKSTKIMQWLCEWYYKNNSPASKHLIFQFINCWHFEFMSW